MRGAWVEPVADAFWERVGTRPPPPRDLAGVIPLAADVFVKAVPGLRPEVVDGWFRACGRPLPIRTADRPLSGCVVAYRGAGAVFVDAGLPADERRVILAHEFAHYLAEYDGPRDRAVRRLGKGLLPVLDGDRAPGRGDELAGLLAGVTIGCHTHYLERALDPAGLEVLEHVERTANELALELLAPRRWVLAEFPTDPAPDPDAVTGVLIARYGLPGRWAAGYAARLARVAAARRSFTGSFGL